MTRRATGEGSSATRARHASRLAGAARHPYRTTLLSLVLKVGRRAGTEREIVALVRRLVNRGRVELIGSFKGERFE
jgi:hypothetical protein